MYLNVKLQLVGSQDDHYSVFITQKYSLYKVQHFTDLFHVSCNFAITDPVVYVTPFSFCSWYKKKKNCIRFFIFCNEHGVIGILWKMQEYLVIDFNDQRNA